LAPVEADHPSASRIREQRTRLEVTFRRSERGASTAREIDGDQRAQGRVGDDRSCRIAGGFQHDVQCRYQSRPAAVRLVSECRDRAGSKVYCLESIGRYVSRFLADPERSIGGGIQRHGRRTVYPRREECIGRDRGRGAGGKVDRSQRQLRLPLHRSR
jgi:hypothetical protein